MRHGDRRTQQDRSECLALTMKRTKLRSVQTCSKASRRHAHHDARFGWRLFEHSLCIRYHPHTGRCISICLYAISSVLFAAFFPCVQSSRKSSFARALLCMARHFRTVCAVMYSSLALTYSLFMYSDRLSTVNLRADSQLP